MGEHNMYTVMVSFDGVSKVTITCECNCGLTITGDGEDVVPLWASHASITEEEVSRQMHWIGWPRNVR